MNTWESTLILVMSCGLKGGTHLLYKNLVNWQSSMIKGTGQLKYSSLSKGEEDVSISVEKSTLAVFIVQKYMILLDIFLHRW